MLSPEHTERLEAIVNVIATDARVALTELLGEIVEARLEEKYSGPWLSPEAAETARTMTYVRVELEVSKLVSQGLTQRILNPRRLAG